VAGGGAARLRKAGIRVDVGVLEPACRAVNQAWEHVVTTGRPLVTLKAAVTLDGRIAARGGDSKWVTGEEARKEGHKLRAEHDAILVGARTVALDDPELTVRSVRGKSPVRVIVDGRLTTRADAKALPAVIVAAEGAPDRPDLVERGCKILHVPATPRPDSGRVDLAEMLRRLAGMNIQSVLVEGGGEIHGQLLEAGLCDRAALFIAPKLIGAAGTPVVAAEGPDQMAKAWKLQGISWKQLGDDILVRGSFVW
jgi:diaminohydroxyphosphoribosylaminopyrimidine deaminase/5-amino-6-(5-phosphoribosylamino)uracil reductase